MNDESPPSIEQVEAWLRLLLAPGQVAELRALGVKRGRGRPCTESGFFDSGHLREMARTALALSPIARGVYFTLNPLRPDLLARRANRVEWAGEGELAKDKDVLCRRWLLVDADPVRDPHVSATEAEKAAAQEVVQAARRHLAGLGWPPPLLADSGNGWHLLYRVEGLVGDGGTVERALKALASRFGTSRAKIDTSVHTPARLCKVPGTWARKGDDMPGRPHRLSRLLEIP